MKLREIFDAAADEARSNQTRKHALKVQQAIAECDGDWTCELRPPKPFDEESGEIFPWTATAVNEADGNKVELSIHFHGSNGPEDGDVYIRKGRLLGSSYKMDLDWPTSKMADFFLKSYNDMIEEALVEISDDFELKLEDGWYGWGHDSGREGIADDAKHDIYDEIIAEWVKHYDKRTTGVVNSEKLALALVPKIEEMWKAALDDRLDYIEQRIESEENGGRA